MVCRWWQSRSALPIEPINSAIAGSARRGKLTIRDHGAWPGTIRAIPLLALLGAGPLAAQSAGDDARLKALIPDAAVADPQAWARAATPAPAATATDLRLDSPMSDLPGTILAPPASELVLPPLVSLVPEAGLGDVLPQPGRAVPGQVAGSVDIAASSPTIGAGDPHGTFSGGRLRIDYALAGGAFPERAVFEARFRTLSAVATLPSRDAGNVGQLAVRAAADRDLLLRLLRTYGYYDGQVIQTVSRPGAAAAPILPSESTAPAAPILLSESTAPAAPNLSSESTAPAATTFSSESTGPTAPAFSSESTAPGANPARLSDHAQGATAVPVGLVVRFEVVPGSRYRFDVINLAQLADTGTDYPALRKSVGIDPGDPLQADAIIAARAGLDTALGQTGYPFARIGDPALLIDHRQEAGDLSLPVRPGGKYRFAGITSTNPRFLSARHLARIARFKPGQTWQRSKVDDLRAAILATGLAASVTVTPRETKAPTPDEPGDVALDVAIAKAKQRTVSAAIGYDTAEGFRLETSWENRNLFPPEGMLRLRAIAGTQEQLAGITFRRNNFAGRDRTLTFDLYAQNADLTAYAARKLAFVATYERVTTLIFQKPWVWSAGVEAVASAEREGMPNGTVLGNTDMARINYRIPRTNYFTAGLPLRVAYDGSDSLLDPQRGWRAALRISPELSLARGKTSPYVSGQLDVSAYQPVAAGTILAERVRLSAIFGTDLENIAPSRRLYAGGGASIRGYGYDLVGPRNPLGELTGGRSLYEGAIEARLHTGLFGGAMSLVPFVDAGGVGAGQTPDLHATRYGAGLGVRYNTGFGPLRIDVGTPLNPRAGDSRVGVYIALGQAF